MKQDNNDPAPHSIDRILTNASLVSQGSRLQMSIAVALISVIPLLSIYYVWQSSIEGEPLSPAVKVALGSVLFLTICTGYALILKYPRTIMRLRDNMERIARGEIPDGIDLVDKESDISAIETYFNLIISTMKERIVQIEEQGRLLLVAERQRVMTESLCTACHCLGQPATSIECYLQLLNREPLSETGHGYLEVCIQESGKLRASLSELQLITEYHTETYCQIGDSPDSSSERIIKTVSDRAAESSN